MMSSKECTEYPESPNIHADDPSNSDDIKVLKVFQDILAHRSYIQTNYKLGKVLKYHGYVLLFTNYLHCIYPQIQNIFINFFQFRFISRAKS